MKKLLNVVSFFLLGIILSVGCKPAPDPMLDMLDTQMSSLKKDDLTRTMEFVYSENRFDQGQFQDKVSSSLNRWAQVDASDETIDSWTLDSFAKSLIDQYATLPMIERTEEISYLNSDAYYLQETSWMNQLTQRIVATPNPKLFEIYRLAAGDFETDGQEEDLLAAVMTRIHPELDVEQATQLAAAAKVFDWVTRNIQLTELVDLSDEQVEKQRLNPEVADPAASGTPGAGYQHFPWQVLMFSRGDYIERAKTFMVMMKLFGLDSVMLATKSKGEDGEMVETLWCPAVVVGGEYYLFDTRLGLPIPAGIPVKMATLSELKKNPDWLAQLDLTPEESLRDDTKYWVTADQLDDLVGLVYVSPESVAKRFHLLESKLPADQPLNLTSQPSEMIKRLPSKEGLEMKAWNVGFETHAYRQAVNEAVKKANEEDVVRNKLSWYFTNEAYINDFTLYRTARAKYFAGSFETVRGDAKANAIELFYALMYDDDKIRSLGSDQGLQRLLGIYEEDSSLLEFRQRIESVQAQMSLVRRDAGYFLAECHVDNGNVGTAINWLDRLRATPGDNRWEGGVNYLLGRCHEARKEYETAIGIYENDQKSPQFHGNVIRARMLGQLTGSKVSAEAAPEIKPAPSDN